MTQLSVIIPSYNSENTIEACLASVVDECNSCSIDYEILVIDDGSNDSSPDIIKKLAEKNKNIIYIRQENAGPSAARNNGLARAQGEFIALNDSDDIWLEGKLKKQFEYLTNNPEVDLVSCQYSKPSKYNAEKVVSLKDMAFHNYFLTPTVVFRKNVNNVQFPENLKYSEDMRYFLTVLLNHKCAYLPFVGSRNFFNKLSFGDSGLSSHLFLMEKGELSNIAFIFKQRKISFFVYIAAIIYSLLKFLRRLIFSTLHKIIKK